MSGRKQYTHLEMEAALCVWEWINDVTLDDTPQVIKEWVELREGVGSVKLRHQSIVLGKWCLKIYDILTKHDGEFFSAMAYDNMPFRKLAAKVCGIHGFDPKAFY